jgi:hypothetical protein
MTSSGSRFVLSAGDPVGRSPPAPGIEVIERPARATQRCLSFALNLKVTGPQGSGFWCTRISFWLNVIWPLA